MRSRPSTLVASSAVAVILALALSACTGSGGFHPVQAVTPSGGTTSGADAVAPATGVPTGKTYLFRTDKPPVKVLPGSITLANMTARIPDMVTTGLPSTEGAAAVMLIETATPASVWGVQLVKAEVEVFKTFAATRSMGDWLILVTDVNIQGGQDPVPATGYRWSRDQVVRYVGCGIPATGSNACKSAFFSEARSVVLSPQGGAPRGQ